MKRFYIPILVLMLFISSFISSVSAGNLMLNTTTGNVGVGTSTPAYKLDVTGDINCTGSYKMDGTDLIDASKNWNGSIISSAKGGTGLSSCITGQILKWNGTAWACDVDQTGLTIGGSTGNVQFNSGGGLYADNNLFWDNTNKRLGVGTNTPGTTLEIKTSAATDTNLLKIGDNNKAAYITAGSSYFGVATSNGANRLSIDQSTGAINLNGKNAFNTADSWLRINESAGFSSGVYFGSSTVRTDNRLEVGSSGSSFYAQDGSAGFNGTVSATGNITAPTFIGNLTGTATNAINAINAVNATNASTATNAGYSTTTGTLATARTINGVSFNGSANISVPSDIPPSTSGNLMMSNGTVWTSSAVPTWNQNTTGNAATASSAAKLSTARTINGVSFDGTSNISVPSNISPGTSGNVMISNGTTWTSSTISSNVSPGTSGNIMMSNGTVWTSSAVPTWNQNTTGNAATATTASYANVVGVSDGDRNAATKLPTITGHGVRFDFVGAGSAGTSGNYAGVMTFAPWDGTTTSTGDASYQLAFGSSTTNGGGTPILNIRNGIDSTWNGWYTIIHSGNIGSQSVNYANSAGSANSVAWSNVTGKPNMSANNFQWNWSGQGGQPTWLWGGGDGSNMYVYNPSNFSVNYANSAGSANTAGTSTYSTYMLPISGSASYKLAYTADGQRTNAGDWGRVVMRYDGNGQTYGVRVDRADYADSAGSAANGAPAGAVMAFYLSSCPSGWVYCDGGNGTPDLRGVFIRGTGTPSGYSDSSGAHGLGTKQDDSLQGHFHSQTVQVGSGGYVGSFAGGPNPFWYNVTLGNVDPTNDGTNGVPRISPETRPKNVALLYCMKQ